MTASDTDGLVPRRVRPSSATTFLRLYQADALFRSSTDFAVIGLAVYLFVAPLPLPSLDWLMPAGASKPGTPATSTVSAPALPPLDIAQAATPQRPRTRSKVGREWFKLSDPAIIPALHRAADEIDKGSGVAALAILDAIGTPHDPNVLNLSAYGALLSRSKDMHQRAYELHLGAAKAGHPESMDQVGQMLRLGQAGSVDLAAAVDWYERGAQAGSLAAAVNAGRAYVNGWARPIDHGKAAQYFRQAAEAGEPSGMNNFGALHLEGQGVPADAKVARVWIEKAASTGLASAQHNMSRLVRKGLGGPRDFDAFLKWAQAAANQGFAPALYDLGMFYLKPDDERPADPARAAGYLRQAALKKHGAAQFAYATLCERGVGVQENPVQAFVYYSLSLRHGESAAQGRLDGLRSRMNPKDVETAQRLVAAAS